MAIEKRKSSFYGQADTAGVHQSSNGSSALGQITRIAGTVSCLAADSAGSVYHLCDIPASAILLPESRIRTTGWGFAQAVVGVSTDTDALLDVTRATGGAAGNQPVSMFGTDWNKPIWEQLGLPADPGQPMTLIVSTIADATADGQIEFDLQFANHV